jgi:maltooligosyltrehalose trehalohydrolase
MDALWNDDFHHSARVALTRRNEAYYSDYSGSAQELVSTARFGFLFQGQRYAWQRKRRGSSTAGLAPRSFVNYIENHDQVANSARGLRPHQLSSPGRWRAMTALLLLSPGTPMLFQGQEFAASSPFLFFADHKAELAAAVRKGRAEFLRQFPSIDSAAMRERLPDPSDPATFRACKLDFAERAKHAHAYALHRDLLAMRHDDVVFSRPAARGVDGAVIGPEAFVLRFGSPAGADRLLLVNLGTSFTLAGGPEPLLAPPDGHAWSVIWSSEDPRYGGGGTPPITGEDFGWNVFGEAAFVLVPERLQ